MASPEAYPWQKAGFRAKPSEGFRKNKFWRSDLTRKIRVLVAEEDTAFLKMIEDSLVESGYPYQIEKVFSGEDCLKRLQKEKFEIL
jgi:PleD family two-component response regulator